jgi:MSHA biogenesis protein MshJ
MFLMLGSFLPIVLMDRLVLQHTMENRAKQVEKVYEIKKQILDLKSSEQQIIINHAFDRNKDIRKTIAELTGQIGKLDERLKDFTIKFIPPKAIPTSLKHVLELQEWLRFEKLTHLEPTPLFQTLQGEEKQGKPQKNPDLITEEGNVFIHTFILEFSGDYHSTLEYLQRLEELPWQFFWESVEIKMDRYPQANVTLTLQTLSLERSLMGI